MAAACVARLGPSIGDTTYSPQKIPKEWKIVLDERSQSGRACDNGKAGSDYARSGQRYAPMYTAMLEGRPSTTTPTPIHRSPLTYNDTHLTASALVAELLKQISDIFLNNDTVTSPLYTPSIGLPHCIHEGSILHVRRESFLEASISHHISHANPEKVPTMDFKVEFGDTSGFQTRGKKQKAKKAAAANDWFGGDGDEKKTEDESGAGDNGSGGNDNGGGDANGGSGGGGDDDNNGGGDDDDWGFGSSKKTKKKKKKQEEEEEEERKKQEEEDKANPTADKDDPLSWADDTNNANDNDDWTAGFTAKKDKKKKKKGEDDSTPTTTSAFQDVSLDDTVPKIDFNFDADVKKTDSGGGGFGAWGKTWDFGAIGGTEEKKESKTKEAEPVTAFGDNNPWSLGSKSKKKTTLSSFEFGDFGATGTNDLTFESNDIGETKGMDDAWGFAIGGKKDKKKKVVGEESKDETKEDIEPPKEKEEEESWGGWGMKTSKKKTKKSGDDAASEVAAKPEPVVEEPETTFDWGFGAKKDKKKKNLISEVEDPAPEPPAEADAVVGGTGDDDWLNSGWGTTTKKTKKGKKSDIEDLSASVNLDYKDDTKNPSNDATVDDLWASFDTKKDKKTKSADVEIAETKEESQPLKEPLVAWDFGLSAKEIKRKEKEMRKNFTWEDRITQEMVDKQDAQSIEPDPEPEPETSLDPEPEVEAKAEKVPWDAGLSTKEKRKKEKQMKLEGTWDDRITQDIIDADVASAKTVKEEVKTDNPEVGPDLELDAEPEPEPAQIEQKVPWDYDLSPKEKKRKEKQMRVDGTWDDRVTQETIDAEAAAAALDKKDEKAVTTGADSKPEPEPASEKLPWDFGLTAKEIKRKEKEMKLNRTWDDRITQEMIDEEAAAASGDKEAKTIDSESETKAAAMTEPLEEKVAWDLGLNSKEKRKKEKEMRLDGTWEDRITQEMIDEEAASAAVISSPKEDESTHPDPEPEPETKLVEQEKIPWDFGLTPKEKRRREKEMRFGGTWENRITQESIDEEAKKATVKLEEDADPESEPIPESVHEVETKTEDVKEEKKPWDFGLSPKEKRKLEKDMKLNKTWESRITQEMIEAEAAAKASSPDPQPEAQELDSWATFGSTSKDKKLKVADIEPAKEEETTSDTWGIWGTTTKDKKKKDKSPPVPDPESEPVQAKTEEKTEDLWSWGATTKDKKKKDKDIKRKDVTSPAEETPIIDVGTVETSIEDDTWGSWGLKDKKVKKSKKIDELPPPAPTPPAQGLTPEPASADAPEIDDFGWGGLDSGKKAKKTKDSTEDSTVKKSSMWGFAPTSTSKTKKEKEKEKEKEEQAKKDEEDKAKREAEEAEATRLAEADAAKKSKSSKSSKSSKVDEKKKSADLLDLLDDSIASPSSSKLKKTSTKSSDNAIDDKTEDKGSTDYFGFWGSAATSKKTTGKKDTDTKKEINKQGLTNGVDPLADSAKKLESPVDEEPTTSSKLTKTMSNSKTKTGLSIAERMKAFESTKDDVEKKSKSGIEKLTKELPKLEETLSPKEEKKISKTKVAGRSSKTTIDTPSSSIATEEKKSKDSVPGSFPGAFGDDDLLGAENPVASQTKEKKESKVEKKVAKSSKSKKIETTQPSPMNPVENAVDLLDDSKLPTPPPEEKRSSKKDRPRVERSATASWGFWGAAPPAKNSSKSKASADASAAEEEIKEKSPVGLTRSKSTRTPKEKDREDRKETDKAEKSSGSDKESKSQKADRPKAGRGMTFSQFMLGGPPPSAMRPKTNRRSSTAGSKTSSRRQSMDESGMLSPPPDEVPETSGKASKVMGLKSGKPDRKQSVKEKSQKKASADPYPIDDDDMVMINTSEQPAIKVKEKSKSRTTTQSRRESTKPRSKTISGDEDVVMVDTVGGNDSHVLSGADDVAFIDHPPALQRSNTGRKIGGFGFLGSFFGGGSKTPLERDISRSNPVTDNEDNALPIRSKSTSKRRSVVPDMGDGFTTDAPMETDADVQARRAERRAKREARDRAEEEEKVAREERRRQRREREQADLEARREKARERARQEREAEEQQKEERRVRRKEKERAERERAEREALEINAAADKRREERRLLREQLEAEAAMKGPSKDEKRRSRVYEEDDQKYRRDEHKSRGDRPRASHRKSSALVEEYHESRSGSGRGIQPPANKTSSWIDSQKEEPPEIPLVEPTVLDESGQRARPVEDGESGSRHRHRKDKYAGMTEAEIEEKRARKRAERRAAEKSTSGGSDGREKRHAQRRNGVEADYYADNIRTFDGRPTIGRNSSNRNSFLGKFF